LGASPSHWLVKAPPPLPPNLLWRELTTRQTLTETNKQTNTEQNAQQQDKRLAADGRGLQEQTINNNFATLSESL
jgi:hypothetical protein